MASLMFFGTLAYLALRSPRFSPAEKTASVVACVLAAVLVGVSRVYLGVHWPSDVIASWCLGGAWFALVVGLVEAS
jgi:undecaprenyl-diphosphatase